MLRIITFNANGVRSAERKGFFEWFLRQDADILCLQELKAAEGDIPETLRALPGYRAWFHCASRKGYSGCGLWSRVEPLAVRTGFGDEEFDAEGRCVEADFEGLTVASVYFPSGSSSDERQQAKHRFLDRFGARMDALKGPGREVVICGDVNIAHKEIDIRNWKGNLDHSGFLPEERAWLDGRLPAARSPARALHVVEPARSGAREERRLAHRLRDRHARDRRARAGDGHPRRGPVLRPRAAHRGL